MSAWHRCWPRTRCSSRTAKWWSAARCATFCAIRRTRKPARSSRPRRRRSATAWIWPGFRPRADQRFAESSIRSKFLFGRNCGRKTASHFSWNCSITRRNERHLLMIPRYSRPEMVSLWTDETKYRIHFEIEAHAADALAELGVIPKAAARVIWDKGNAARIDVDRILEIEKETRHETIAFTTHLAELIGPEARFVHQGMTSSDVLDTTLSVQLARATDILIADVDLLLAALKKRALEHKYTLTIGRSHGIHGEPTTFGLKLAGFYAEFVRAKERLAVARAEIATCAISGAMGTFANVDPRVEEHVAKKLGLKVEPVSTQVIPRDRHAAYFAALGVIASSIERLATEIRHPQRTE